VISKNFRLTGRAHFTYLVTILAAVAGLAYARVSLAGLGFLADTLVQTLIVGTNVARAQTLFVHRILHQVIRTGFRFKTTDATCREPRIQRCDIIISNYVLCYCGNGDIFEFVHSL